jgi:UbiD family decarboxylase
MDSDMRSFIATLERAGRLRRIGKIVDRAWEPATLVKWMYQAMPASERFAMLFEHVGGSAMPLLTAALGASPETFALALGVEPVRINATIVNALRARIAPRTVEVAPCQEIVLRGADASLDALPIPTWTPGKDAGPYITTIVTTRNAQNAQHNYGVYRTQVLDAHRVALNTSPGRQGTRNVRTFHSTGKTAPVAWVVAAPPAVHIAAVANLPYGQNEMDFAGGLAGAPVELVRCVTSDLLVPANAEIIIEGEIAVGETTMEGPFGEFAGYMGAVEERPVARITAITHRRDAFFYGLGSQMPPSESTMIQSLTNAGVIMKLLRDDLGDQSVSDVYIDLTFGGMLAHGIIAMTPTSPAHGKKIGRMVADVTGLKRVTVVDADIDIRDPDHVDWALNARFNPARDTVIIDDVFFSIYMDPSLPLDGAENVAHGSKIVIDATAKRDPGTFSLPSRETMDRGLAVWNEIGLPPLTIPKRANLRFNRP